MISLRKCQLAFPSDSAQPPQQPQPHSLREQPHAQGAPFLRFRHTASAISAPTAANTTIDPFDISRSPIFLSKPHLLPPFLTQRRRDAENEKNRMVSILE
jgi:hypothetical protein